MQPTPPLFSFTLKLFHFYTLILLTSFHANPSNSAHTHPLAQIPYNPTFQLLGIFPPSFFAFKNSSNRKNFLPSAPLYADHSGSPESLASAARTAASLESISSK